MFISDDFVLELARIEAAALRAVAARMAATQHGEAFRETGSQDHEEDRFGVSLRDLRRAA